MNKIILIGRITRDADVRYNNDTGRSVARFSLAVDRRRVQETDFINCVAFDKTAENAEKYFKKGLKLCVVGHLQIGSYTNKDGQKVNTADVIVDEWEFVEKKQDSAQTAQNQNYGGQRPQTNNYAPKPTEPHRSDSDAFKRGQMGDGFMSIPDDVDSDALPFN